MVNRIYVFSQIYLLVEAEIRAISLISRGHSQPAIFSYFNTCQVMMPYTEAFSLFHLLFAISLSSGFRQPESSFAFLHEGLDRDYWLRYFDKGAAWVVMPPRYFCHEDFQLSLLCIDIFIASQEIIFSSELSLFSAFLSEEMLLH